MLIFNLSSIKSNVGYIDNSLLNLVKLQVCSREHTISSTKTKGKFECRKLNSIFHINFMRVASLYREVDLQGAFPLNMLYFLHLSKAEEATQVVWSYKSRSVQMFLMYDTVYKITTLCITITTCGCKVRWNHVLFVQLCTSSICNIPCFGWGCNRCAIAAGSSNVPLLLFCAK